MKYRKSAKRKSELMESRKKRTIEVLRNNGLVRRSSTVNIDFIESNIKEKEEKEGIMEFHGRKRKISANSFYCLTQQNKFRYYILWIIKWKWFEYFIILIIVLNSITLSIYDYTDKQSLTLYNQTLDHIGYFFNAIFIIEATLKILGLGFVMHPKSYLRNAWNVMDLIVVATAILEMSSGISAIKAVRAFRVLRPLRSIHIIPSMRKLVKILIISLPSLFHIWNVLFFFIYIFSIIGLQQFSGQLYSRCRLTPKPLNSTYWPIDTQYESLCSTSNPASCQLSAGQTCGNPSQYGISLADDNVSNNVMINYGVATFDNIGTSILSIFQSITLFGWSQMMYDFMSSTNSIFSAAFFCFLVLFGSYFLLNFVLAVIMDSYKKMDLKEQERLRKLNAEKVRKQQSRFAAIKQIFKMMRLTEKKMELLERGGVNYQQTFYDVVFAIMIQELYNKLQGSSHQSPGAEIAIEDGNAENADFNNISNYDNNGSLKKSTKADALYKSKNDGRDESSMPQIHIVEEDVEMEAQNTNRPQNSQNEEEKERDREGNSSGEKARRSAQTTLVISPKRFPGMIGISTPKLDVIKEKERRLSHFVQLDQIAALNLDKIAEEIEKKKEEKSKFKKEIMQGKAVLDKYAKNISSAKKDKSISLIQEEDLNINTSKDKSWLRIETGDLSNTNRGLIKLNRIESSQSNQEKTDTIVTPSRNKSGNPLDIERQESTDHQLMHIFPLIKPVVPKPMADISQLDIMKEIQKAPRLSFHKKKTHSGQPRQKKKPSQFRQTDQSEPLNETSSFLLNNLVQKQMSGQFQSEKQTLNDANKEASPTLLSMIEIRTRHIPFSFAKIKGVLLKIVENKYFDYLMTALIVINVIVLCIYRYPMPSGQLIFYEESNYFFYSCFVLELILKMVGMGPRAYFKDQFNIMDFIIVTINSLEVILLQFQTLGTVNQIVKIFKSFRILRLLKIIKRWKNLQEFIATIINTFMDMSNFSVLLFICIFAYTLLSLEFFSYAVKFDAYDNVDPINGVSPQNNFDGFLNAFSSIFIILSGENWQIIMYNVARAVNVYTIFFFVSLVILGQIILLNLFLAVLIENFEEKRRHLEMQRKKDLEGKSASFRKLESGTWSEAKDCYLKCKHRLKKMLQFADPKESFFQSSRSSDLHSSSASKRPHEKKRHNSLFKISQKFHRISGMSLYIFKEDNPFRMKVSKLAQHLAFELTIFSTILLSTILLALENPLQNPNSPMGMTFYYIEICIALIFDIEVILKVIALGFLLNGPNSYLRSKWNCFDFIIIVLSMIPLCFNNQNSYSIQFLKTVRVLRPFRIVNKNKGLKVAAKALMKAVPSIFNVLIVCFVFFILFGVMCVNFFSGAFYSCNTEMIDPSLIQYIVERSDCVNYGGTWQNSNNNFDNILQAFMNLFIIGQVSWVDTMWIAVNSLGINQQPSNSNGGANKYWIIFFIILKIVLQFFLFKLFDGVVVSTFKEEKEQQEGKQYLTESQNEWLRFKYNALKLKPLVTQLKPDESKLRKLAFTVCQSKIFEYCILVCIFLNTIIMSLHWYGMPTIASQIVENCTTFFTCIFTLEATIKLISFKKDYFKVNWNIFDFIIVIISWASIIIDNLTTSNIGQSIIVMRSLRGMLILRLLEKTSIIKFMINTLLLTLPNIFNVGGLLIIIIYVYAVLGMFAFAKLKLQDNLNVNANFQNFSNSFLTLIRASSGEGWDAIMYDMMAGSTLTNQCIADPTQQQIQANFGNQIQCGLYYPAIFFMFSFQFIVSIIFLKLFVAIIIIGFDEMNQREKELLNITEIMKFRAAWAKFDPLGEGLIDVEQFIQLMIDMGPPLGMPASFKDNTIKMNEFMKAITIPTYNNGKNFNYHDLLISLGEKAYSAMEKEKKISETIANDNLNNEEKFHGVIQQIKDEFIEAEKKPQKIEIVGNIKELQERQHIDFTIWKDLNMDSQNVWLLRILSRRIGSKLTLRMKTVRQQQFANVNGSAGEGDASPMIQATENVKSQFHRLSEKKKPPRLLNKTSSFSSFTESISGMEEESKEGHD